MTPTIIESTPTNITEFKIPYQWILGSLLTKNRPHRLLHVIVFYAISISLRMIRHLLSRRLNMYMRRLCLLLDLSPWGVDRLDFEDIFPSVHWYWKDVLRKLRYVVEMDLCRWIGIWGSGRRGCGCRLSVQVSVSIRQFSTPSAKAPNLKPAP